MVPLDEDRTILDVMMALRLPLILVTGSYRGTISHTLTALDSLFRRDMNVLATIVSETPGSDVPLDDVVSAIARFTAPVIGAAAPARLGMIPKSLEAGFRKRSGADKISYGRSRLREKANLQHGFHRAFEIEQGVQQERQQSRAAAPTHPAEKQADDENLQDAGPVVLDVQRRP